DRRTQLTPFPDPDSELQPVTETAAGAISGRVGVGWLALPAWTDDRLPARANRACPSVVTDRHIFVVGQQRVVGPELLADIGRVMNADVEVSVVADQAGHVQPDLSLADELRFNLIAISLV